MKRIMMLLLVFTLTFTFTACSQDNSNKKILEGTLEEILTDIYAYEALSDDFKNNTVPSLVIEDVNADNVANYLGKSGIEFKEAIASESNFSIFAYSLVLIRANDGQDIEKLKRDIKENADPQKWICVGVDPSNVIVDNIGDVVILIMSNVETQNLRNAFLALN